MRKPLGKRKHVATGKRRGGPRPGAGRKEGTPDVLPRGAVEAIRASRFRVPEDASPEHAALAGHALARVAEVLDGKVNMFAVKGVLKAATIARLEVCGPHVQKLEHSGAVNVHINFSPPTKDEEKP